MAVEKRDFGFSDDPQTYAIIGAAMEVHSTLGSGFLEAVYHDALPRQFSRRDLHRAPMYRTGYVHSPRIIRQQGGLRTNSATRRLRSASWLRPNGPAECCHGPGVSPEPVDIVPSPSAAPKGHFSASQEIRPIRGEVFTEPSSTAAHRSDAGRGHTHPARWAIEHAQVINYLKATGHWCGLLLNFGSTSLFHRRLVNGPRPSTSPPSNDSQ